MTMRDFMASAKTRLAGWEAAWATAGPQWTRRFRSRG